MKRFAFVLLCALLAYLMLEPHTGGARTNRASLELIGEVRNLIHRNYVAEVDSLQLIDGAIDGMMAILSQGLNVYISPDEKSDMGAAPAVRPALSNRQQVNLLGDVLRRVRRHYVDKVAIDTLSRGAIWGMLATLDPHSNYLDAEEYEHMSEQFSGEFEGIGIFYEVRQGNLLVISPILGSPSYGKLRAGDHIVEIEGVSTEGITSEQVMEKLRGPPGSRVRISVARQGVDEWLNITIRRARIDVTSVPYAFMLRPETAYVRVIRFGEKTGAELGTALDSLRRQGARRLLLDLRNNGGGLLSQAVAVADYFVDKGELIVYTEGRDPASRQDYRARHANRDAPLSLVILLDHGSASASEIVAGAVQDMDLGLIAGQTSFGKGLVQEQYPLNANGGLLLLTVARYYTPLGRLIQRPYTDDVQAYIREGTDDLDPNAIDSLRAEKQVFHTALGRKVYGGGGITPDVLLASEDYTDFMRQLHQTSALFDFAGRWVGQHAEWGGSFEDFLQQYHTPQAALDSLRLYLGEIEVDVNNEVFAAHRDYLDNQLKAGTARILWGDEQRYRIIAEGDAQITQALELFPQADDLAFLQRKRAGNN